MVLTCDRYPKEVDGIEDRLRSRFSSGLTVAIEPPEYETRVAIIKSKAESAQIDLPDNVAFFIAKRFVSNVRELEGALNRGHRQFQPDRPTHRYRVLPTGVTRFAVAAGSARLPWRIFRK